MVTVVPDFPSIRILTWVDATTDTGTPTHAGLPAQNVNDSGGMR